MLAAVTAADVEAVLDFAKTSGKADINWKPPRVIMQDLSGIPALMDLCAMRDALAKKGGIAPLVAMAETGSVEAAMRAAWALANLAVDCAANKTAIREGRALPPARSAITRARRSASARPRAWTPFVRVTRRTRRPSSWRAARSLSSDCCATKKRHKWRVYGRHLPRIASRRRRRTGV